MKLRFWLTHPISLIIILFFTGCIDDNGKCPQGLRISFYSKTPCATDTTYFSWNNNMVLCVFDKNNILANYKYVSNVEPEKDYIAELEVADGLYSVISWFGIETTYYNISSLQIGLTQKDDILLELKRNQQQAESIENTRLYQGENPAVYVEGRRAESIFNHVSVNLQEITNRLTVSIEGIEENPENYEIYIESNNGSMNLNGGIAQDITLRHNPVTRKNPELLKDEFTLLKLETGYTYTLVVNDKANNKELYRESLLGTLLLKNPNINLNCDHDFTISFTAEDQCECGTYNILEIWVNDWLVHSYSTGLLLKNENKNF